jgi:hypothetical protein
MVNSKHQWHKASKTGRASIAEQRALLSHRQCTVIWETNLEGIAPWPRPPLPPLVPGTCSAGNKALGGAGGAFDGMPRRRRLAWLPVEDGARAEGAAPVAGVCEPRGVAEPVGARHPRDDGRHAVVVPERRGQRRVVARVVPETLRATTTDRRASHTHERRAEGKRERAAREEGVVTDWEDDGRAARRGGGGGGGVGGRGAEARRREEGEHGRCAAAAVVSVASPWRGVRLSKQALSCSGGVRLVTPSRAKAGLGPGKIEMGW